MTKTKSSIQKYYGWVSPTQTRYYLVGIVLLILAIFVKNGWSFLLLFKSIIAGGVIFAAIYLPDQYGAYLVLDNKGVLQRYKFWTSWSQVNVHKIEYVELEIRTGGRGEEYPVLAMNTTKNIWETIDILIHNYPEKTIMKLLSDIKELNPDIKYDKETIDLMQGRSVFYREKSLGA